MKARTIVGGREECLLCDPGSELRNGRELDKKREDNRWDGKYIFTYIFYVIAVPVLCGIIRINGNSGKQKSRLRVQIENIEGERKQQQQQAAAASSRSSSSSSNQQAAQQQI